MSREVRDGIITITLSIPLFAKAPGWGIVFLFCYLSWLIAKKRDRETHGDD